MIRRLAPDCCRIELLCPRMVTSSICFIHLGSRDKIAALKKDLAARKGALVAQSR
jgi:hypothetical protein